MASLTQRTFVLALSQTLTFAIQFLSPIFLVRLLDKTTFGQYKEFIVYSSLCLSFISLGIKHNLLYFVSIDKRNEKTYVTNTVFLLFTFSLVGIAVLYLFKGQIERLTTYSFFLWLLVYVFCYQNIDLLDSLLLARKRSDHVLYWSTANILIRTGALIWVAYKTADILTIIYLMILLEIGKTAFTLFYLLKNRLLGLRVDFGFIKEQLIYILPLGFGALILQLNTNLSNVIISVNLGAAALAIYAIGSQKVPLINIVLQSVTHVIFPEMAQRVKKDPLLALDLWKQSTVIYVYLMVPGFLILFVYADVVINTLFTKNYSEAIPLFRIYLLLLIRKCFEVGAPLRAMNKNKYFVFGNILSLVVNVSLMYALFKLIGFYGPAIAFITSEFVLVFFLSVKIIAIYNINLAAFMPWKKVGTIVLVNLFTMPVLLLRHLFALDPIVAAVLFSSLFMVAYLLVIRKAGVDEVDHFMTKVLRKARISWKKRAVVSN